MIVLFTDYGFNGPYLGQVSNILIQGAPDVPVINLVADAPKFDPKRSAYLLAALHDEFPIGTVFFAVVDPSVGGTREPGVLEADGRWYVGPDNGLFELIIRRANRQPRWWEIIWRPDRLSATFHGRDLFAPIAARLACGDTPDKERVKGKYFRKKTLKNIRRLEWPDDLAEIIYIDDFGNAITGLRFDKVPRQADIYINNIKLPRCEKFTDVPRKKPFFYKNSNGLLEISVNQGSVEEILEITPGVSLCIRNFN